MTLEQIGAEGIQRNTSTTFNPDLFDAREMGKNGEGGGI